MVRTPDQGPYVSHTREMRGIQTADGAATDNANPFHLLMTRLRSLTPKTPSYDARRSSFTNFSAWQISFPTNARNKLSALLNESSMMMPFENSASCKAAEIVWMGAAPPSPIPLAPL